MNKQSLKIFQFIATIGLLSLVFYQVGLFSEPGRLAFVDTLKGADIGFLLGSFVIGVVVNMVSAMKWYALTQAQHMGAGYWRIFSYYLIGQFYNLFLPTSVGGDVVRSYELGKFSNRQADALASVFVERYTGVLVLLLLACLAVASQLSRFNVDFVIVSLLVFALGLALIAWLVFDNRVYRTVKATLEARWPVTARVFTKLDKLMLSVDHYRTQPRAICWALVNSLAFYFVAVINVYVTALVFNANVTFLDMLIATPIIMLIMNLPISIGNIGLMEAGYIGVLVLMGYDPALGLSVALLMRIKSLFDGTMGGLLHPFFVTQKHQ